MGPGRDAEPRADRPRAPLVPAILSPSRSPALAPQPQGPGASAGTAGARAPRSAELPLAIDPHQLERRQPVDKVAHKQM
jgi:hypothetical protein